jgi:GT2 family glycosyltransferase
VTSVRYVAGASGPPHGQYDADIVILALDRAKETEAAIASVLSQDGVARHLFVVDQGSGLETLDRLARAVGGRDDATLVSLGSNRGVPAGRNAGSALGHGRVIIGLDNDAAFGDRTTLARAVAAMDAAPDVGAIGFRILDDATGRDDLSSWGYPLELLGRAGEAFDTVTFVGAGHAIRRAVWQQAGGYDESLFFCWEEYDFCLRAIERGWRVCYRGDIAVLHKLSAERRVGWSDERWFRFVRNRLYIERKWGASRLSLMPRIGGYVIKGVRNGQGVSTVRAIAGGTALSPGRARYRPSARTLDYLRRNDRAHRGSIFQRLRLEVMGTLCLAGTGRSEHAEGKASR